MKCRINPPNQSNLTPRFLDLDQAKTAVLATLRSRGSRRCYEHAITEFIAWYCSEPRLSFSKGVVTRYRMQLEARGLAPGTVNLRLAAVRRLAYEAADLGLLSPEQAAGIRRVKGAKKLGIRVGNWLLAEEGRALWQSPDTTTLKGKRDQAILSVLLACGLRRGELAELEVDDIQRRDDHWAVVDLAGKGGHVRTVPVPDWVKGTINDWLAAACITNGRLFRCVCRAGKAWGKFMTDRVVWHVVKDYGPRSACLSWRPMTSAARALVFATRQAGSWSRFNSCSAMFQSKRQKGIWDASSDFETQSMIALGLSPTLEEEQGLEHVNEKPTFRPSRHENLFRYAHSYLASLSCNQNHRFVTEIETEGRQCSAFAELELARSDTSRSIT